MKSIRAIAKTTLIELLSQPITMLLVLSGLVLTALIPLLQFHDFGEPGRLARDGALAYQLVIGCILSVFSVSRSIRDELENGIALAALAKPVSRMSFLMGKFLGTATLLLLFWLATLALAIVAARVSPRFVDLGAEGMRYMSDSLAQLAAIALPALSLAAAAMLHRRRHARFCLSATIIMVASSMLLLATILLFDRQWHFAPSSANADLRIVSASLPVLFATIAECAFAAAMSLRLPASAVSLAMLALFCAGLSWNSLIAAHPLLAAIPVIDIQAFWVCDMLSNGGTVPAAHLFCTLAYSSALVVFALGCGYLAFRRREIN